MWGLDFGTDRNFTVYRKSRHDKKDCEMDSQLRVSAAVMQALYRTMRLMIQVVKRFLCRVAGLAKHENERGVQQ